MKKIVDQMFLFLIINFRSPLILACIAYSKCDFACWKDIDNCCKSAIKILEPCSYTVF